MTAAEIILRPDLQGWVSGSALAAGIKCAASAVLWRVLGSGSSASTIGSALHEHIRHRNLYGVSSAVEMLPELAARFELDEDETALFIARAKAFEWSPPRGSVAELALCLFEDGRVEAVRGGKGQYDDLPPDALVPAQIDLFWAEPTPLFREGDRIVCPPESTLWVVDFKSGREDYVDAAEQNAQAVAGAVLAGKYTGAQRVISGIVFLRKGQGIWDIPDFVYDRALLDHSEKILRDAVSAVREQADRHRRGLPLAYREGMHCNLCRARHACPAHLASIKGWLAEPNPIEPGALSDEQARRLAEIAPSLRRFVASIDAALRVHVEESQRPIELSDGRRWGPHAKGAEVFDPDKAVEALAVEVGPEKAAKAIKRTISKQAIERVIKADHAEREIKRKGAEAMRGVYGRLRAADGIRKVARVQWGVFKPPRELPPDDERAHSIAALHGIPMDGDDLDDDEDVDG